MGWKSRLFYHYKKTVISSGLPQTFDNWIQGLFKDFQGQQQQFSRIYFKPRPPLPPFLAIHSSHKTFFFPHNFDIKLDDADAKVGQKQIQGLFQGFYSILAKFKDFQGLENEAIFFKDVGTLRFTPCQEINHFFKWTRILNI